MKKRKNKTGKAHSVSGISDFSGKLSVRALSLDLEKLTSDGGHKQSTRHVYHAIWQKFNQFVIQLDNIPPTWEERVSLYCTFLITVSGLQSSTIKTYISAIKAKLRSDGYEWCDKLMVFNSLVNACRDRNDTLKDRLPIQAGLFQLMTFELNRMFARRVGRLYLITMYRAVYMCLYYGLMRIGEITASEHVVQARHVHQAKSKKQILLILYSSKTHSKANRPQQIKIQKHRFDTEGYCPVEAINDYITLRPPYDPIDEQFFIFQDHTVLRAEQVRQVLRATVNNLGLNPNNYDTHSFRIGRATDQFKYGICVEDIKKYGRWESNAVYKYLRG